MDEMERSTYNRKYYQANRESRIDGVMRRQRDIRDAVQSIKLSAGCSVCGYSKSARALQFHHNGEDKEHNIAKMVTQGRVLDKIMVEIGKCTILCANCHAEHHEEQDLALSFTG